MNVAVLLALQDLCATKHVRKENTVKNVDKNVSAKTMVNVILKVENVIVPLAGPVMFVLIAVNLDLMVLIVQMFVNVIMVAIVITLPVNVSAVQDLRVRNVWTVARAIRSVSIAARLVAARIKRSAINRTEVALARKVGLVLTVVREIALTICTDLTVKILANAMQTTPICAIRGVVNAIAKLDGVAAFAIGRVLSLRMAKIVIYLVTVRTVLNARRLMDRVHVRRASKDRNVKRRAKKERMVKIVRKLATA